jgi:hypothetical protein
MSICLRNRDPPRRQSAQSCCSRGLFRQFLAAMQNHSVTEVTVRQDREGGRVRLGQGRSAAARLPHTQRNSFSIRTTSVDGWIPSAPASFISVVMVG